MKRTITFLLVLSIAMTTFACTSKPKPEPETFTPLQNQLVSAVYPDQPDQNLRINWIHAELLETLNGSSWTLNDALLDQGGLLRVQLTDVKSDVYRFYAPANGQIKAFVSVTLHEDGRRVAYELSESIITTLMTQLEDYAESIRVLQSPLVSLTAVDQPVKLVNDYLLESLRRKLLPEQWALVKWSTQLESNKRYVLLDEQGDTYSFYDIASNAQTAYVTVERADKTQLMFRVNSLLLDELDHLMELSADVAVSQFYTDLLKAFIPKSVYFGPKAAYDESKLVELPADVIELFHLRASSSAYSYLDLTEPLDPTTEILFIAKSEDGTMLTVYDHPSSKPLPWNDSSCIFSIGKYPLGDSRNITFEGWLYDGIRLYHTLALSPTGEDKPLSIEVDVNATFTFPVFDMDYEVRQQAFSGQMNQAMVDFLQTVETLDWSLVTMEDVKLREGIGYPYSVIITSTRGTRYLISYGSNELIVDEDPLTPGALVYTVPFDSLRSLGSIPDRLEYLAQLTSDYAFTNLQLDHYTLSSLDESTNEDVFEEIPFTEAQSSALATLIVNATLYKKTYANARWAWHYDAYVVTTTGVKIGLVDLYPFQGEPAYGVMTIIDSSQSIDGNYFISVEDYNAILELYRSFLK